MLRLHRSLVLAALLLAPAIASAQSPGDAAARVHRSGGYASRLPVAAGSGSGGSGGIVFYGGGGGSDEDQAEANERERRQRARERARDGRARRAENASGRSITLPPGSSTFSWVLLIGLFAVLLAIFVFFLAKMRPREGDIAPPMARVRMNAEPAAAVSLPLAVLDADPDALAAQGRFADAIAAALLSGLRAVGWTPEGKGRSSTAREILDTVQPRDAHEQLAELVGIEERVAFGGGEATRERWQNARSYWAALTRRGPSA